MTVPVFPLAVGDIGRVPLAQDTRTRRNWDKLADVNWRTFLDQYRADNVRADTFANRGTASKAGRLFFPNDGFELYRDNGTSWQGWGPLFPFTDPTLQTFAWINQGSATVDATKGAITLTVPGAAGAGASYSIRKKAAPATPYKITAYMLPMVLAKEFHSYGLCFRESSSGKLHLNLIQGNGVQGSAAAAYYYASQKDSDPSTFVANYQLLTGTEAFRWLRIADDGTNRLISFSQDGQKFVTLHSIGRTDYLTANEVGFFVCGACHATPNIDASVTLLSWLES